MKLLYFLFLLYVWFFAVIRPFVSLPYDMFWWIPVRTMRVVHFAVCLTELKITDDIKWAEVATNKPLATYIGEKSKHECMEGKFEQAIKKCDYFGGILFWILLDKFIFHIILK